MKKNRSIIALCLVVLLGLTSCKEKLNLDTFKTALSKEQTAYKVTTAITYKSGTVELNSNSSLSIGKDGSDKYVAKYTYDIEKLGEITSSSSPKEVKEEGTLYYSGDQIGKVTGDSIEWKSTNTLEGAPTASFDLESSYFEIEPVIIVENESPVLTGDIKDDSISSVISGVSGISDVNIRITLNAEKERAVTKIELDYSVNNGTVKIVIDYDYNLQTVTIPAA